MTPRDWLASALGNGPAPSLAGVAPDVLLQVAEEEGVLPLLEWRFREAGGASIHLPAAFREELRKRARAYVAASMIRQASLASIAQVLAAAGLSALLLKGPAFATWLYPEPHLRVSGDIDLLFGSREEAVQAADRLAALGYVLAFSPGEYVYEMTLRPSSASSGRHEIDLHWRAINQELFAGRLEYQALAACAMGLSGLPESLRGLCEADAFLHACMHRAHDMALHRPDHLKWVYDIHLMVDRLEHAGWDRVLERIIDTQLAGVCLRSIEDATTCFGTRVSLNVIDRLWGAARVEPLEAARLGDWRYIQGRNFMALPTIGAKLRWLWQRLVPTHSHLRELHGEGSWLQLMARRLKAGLARNRERS
jgi:hypothetical protein